VILFVFLFIDFVLFSLVFSPMYYIDTCKCALVRYLWFVSGGAVFPMVFLQE